MNESLSIIFGESIVTWAGLVINHVSTEYHIPFVLTAIALKYTNVPAGNHVINHVNNQVPKDAHVCETLVPAQSLNHWIVLRQNPRSIIFDPQLLVIVAPKIPVVANTQVEYAHVMIGC